LSPEPWVSATTVPTLAGFYVPRREAGSLCKLYYGFNLKTVRLIHQIGELSTAALDANAVDYRH